MLQVDNTDVAIVKEIFPEIFLLENKETQEKVARIWAYTWRQSSWESLVDVCYDPQVSNFLLVDHVKYTVKESKAIADLMEERKGISLNRELLYTLALLHDVSKVVEFEQTEGKNVKSYIGENIQHGFYGAHLALLEGFSLDLIHLILTHTPLSKMRPNIIEGILFCHIDEADADLMFFTDGQLDRLCLRSGH